MIFFEILLPSRVSLEICQKQQKLSKIQWLHEITIYLIYPRSCLRRPMLPWPRRSFQRTSATILESRATSTFIVRLSKPCSLVLELSNVGMEERISKDIYHFLYICISLHISFFSIFLYLCVCFFPGQSSRHSEGTDNIGIFTFFSLCIYPHVCHSTNKNNKSHHHAMPQWTAIDFSWQLQMPGVFCLSRFDSLLLGILAIFRSHFQESESSTTSHDSWSSDVFILHH